MSLGDPIPNAPYPTAGQGLVLDSNGQLPLAVRQTLPGYIYSHTEFTANVTSTATTEAAAVSVITAPALTFDGQTAVVLEFFSPNSDCNTANRNLNFSLFESINGAAAASIGIIGGVNIVWTGGGFYTFFKYRFTPSAGTHVFDVRFWIGGGAATAHVTAGTAGAGTNVPGYLEFKRA